MQKNILLVIGLVAALIIMNPAGAQKVKLGAQCSNFLFSNFLDKKEKPFHLSDLKGKLVILDFWSVNCSSCIRNFPLVDSLQRKFKNEIKIIAITKSQRAQVEKLFSRLNDRHDIPFIVDDIAFYNRFPYIGVPNIVWIDKTGKFLAATDDEPLTEETIERLLKEEKVAFEPKINAVFFDEEKILEPKNLVYHSVLTHYQPEIKGSGTMFYKGGFRNGRIIINQSIGDLFAQTIDPNDDLLRQRIIIHSKDSARIFNGSDRVPIEWTRKNAYCYQLIVDSTRIKDIDRLMINDLENQFQLNARIMKLDTECLVLKRISSVEYWKANGKEVDAFIDATPGDHHRKFLQNIKLMGLVYYLALTVKNFYALDETGINEPVNIEFYSSLNDMEGMNKELEKYGLRIDRERRKVPFLLIEDKLTPNLNSQ